ncbi:hypothetical protein MUP77_12165, partial [Candidatus Bathyarchaeota archaeon]|nr:hypothetical protein [Candidatus Bathyarchaeota archaeon]
IILVLLAPCPATRITSARISNLRLYLTKQQTLPFSPETPHKQTHDSHAHAGVAQQPLFLDKKP